MCKVENVTLKNGKWFVAETYYPDMTCLERYKECFENRYFCLEILDWKYASYIATRETNYIFMKANDCRWASQRIYYDNEFVFWSAIKTIGSENV